MKTRYTLNLQRYAQEGDLQHTYAPLHNLVDSNGKIIGFQVAGLNTDFEHPINMECQPSYDGTVNLILTDDKNPPRIVNSRFTKIENNRFRVINRNQTQQSNLYDEDKIDLQTRLIKSTDKIPIVSLLDVLSGGNLKGGCYTFYIKLADEDQNETDFVAESGHVYIYKGSYEKISSISGTLADETTDKIIKLKIQNVDRAFPKLFLYFTRATSDLNGIKQTKAYRVKLPYDINNSTETITLNGFEELVELDESKLNVQYNIITKAKTEAQVQNMIFFGNIEQNNVLIDDLQALSYYIKVSIEQGDDIGWISPDDYSIRNRLKPTQCEYYNPLNLYYKLGYWPNELYRLGVVYIMQDGSLSPVFNLRGRRFTEIGQSNFDYDTEKLRDNNGELIKLNKNKILNSPNWLDNTMGVFQNPSKDVNIINYKEKKVCPLYYKIDLSSPVAEELKKLGVRGYFYVRQKRLPLTLCQAYSVGIDPGCYIPVLYDKTTEKPRYIAESFINKNKELVNEISNRIITTSSTNGSGLIAPEVTMIAELRSLFDGAEFGLFRTTNDLCTKVSSQNDRHYYVSDDNNTEFETTDYGKNNLIYIGDSVNSKLLKGYVFSTQAGNAADISQFGLFNDKSNYSADNTSLVRGNYTPFVGVTSNLPSGEIYNIMQRNYNDAYLENYMQIRGEDTAPFYAISDRFALDDTNSSHDIYRGDCFTNTVTVRINRNFIDPEVPTNDIIVDKYTWRDNYKGLNYMKNNIDPDQLKDGYGDYININRSDVNTVPLGMWITYKCLSNYNLCLRSIDTTNVTEMSLMGNARSFYPVEEMSTSSAAKVQDSTLLNQGLNSTLGARQNFIAPNLPYIKDQFDNRIMFSDVQTYGNFQNAYRIFKSLDYQDIERQYGAIVKLVTWNNNLICVFEHGVGYIPVNEKALVSTQSGQSIHMYGAGVLQNQITVINPDFGSIWQDSIIRTPVGLYGVDTTAKKIWRFSQQNGFETISDLKIQKFLNDNIKLNELDKTVKVALRNVKTHYNNFKGDVMFTFYNDDVAWNICYNERMNKWVTRYTWIPLCSENIDNIFYSFDRNGYVLDIAKQADGEQLAVRQGPAGLYVHGQAGVFDKSEGVEIKPTYWYDKQEKFEFEFVCNDQVGAHKIFNNLVIISNNSEPEKFEFIIDGDVYKENIQELDLKGDVILNGEVIDSKDYPNKKALRVDEDCKNIRKVGRRLGNTQYVEDSWYTQITPIKYEHDNKQKETRIRDKYVRIRVIYSGEDLTVITALKTIYTISYA